MRKIIAAFDGLRYCESTEKYAITLSCRLNCMLVGIFLEDFTYHSYKLSEIVEETGVSETKLRALRESDRQTRNKSRLKFMRACEEAELNATARRDESIAIQELLKETIYADLLVISRNETLTHSQEPAPTEFIRELLADVQCPVLLTPDDFHLPQKVILLYDGEPSSVYAARMFSCLFSDLKKLPVEVVSVRPQDDQRTFPEAHLVKEFIDCHYPDAQLKLLTGNPEAEIIKHIKQQEENALVVLGAYRRNMVSRWFKPSMADVLMKNTDSPLFIAHYK